LKPAYYTVNNIKNFFTEPKDPITLFCKSGVYEIQRSEYPGVYIEQTRRELKTRLAEHKNPNRLSFDAHILNQGNDFDASENFLHYAVGKGSKLSALEDLKIIKAKYEPNIRSSHTNEDIGTIHTILCVSLKKALFTWGTATTHYSQHEGWRMAAAIEVLDQYSREGGEMLDRIVTETKRGLATIPFS